MSIRVLGPFLQYFIFYVELSKRACREFRQKSNMASIWKFRIGWKPPGFSSLEWDQGILNLFPCWSYCAGTEAFTLLWSCWTVDIYSRIFRYCILLVSSLLFGLYVLLLLQNVHMKMKIRETTTNCWLLLIEVCKILKEKFKYTVQKIISYDI